MTGTSSAPVIDRALTPIERVNDEVTKLEQILDHLHDISGNVNGPASELNGNPQNKRNFDPSLYIKNKSVVKEDEFVLIKLPSQGSKIVQLKRDKVVSLGKFGMFEVNQIFGYKFGQTFEVLGENNVKAVDGRKLLNDISAIDQNDNDEETVNENEIIAEELEESGDSTNKDKADIIKNLMKYSEDNSKLMDLGAKVQKLSTTEIETMKKESYSSETGKKIIESIINQHGNFDKKTKYSQVKYLKRKKEKYARYFIVEYLSPRELLNFYIENKDLRKSLDISEETMAYMLSLANVRPGGKYLIVDESLGLLTYAMLERMNGQGEIVIISENEHVNLSALEKYSNYPQIYLSKMVKTTNWLQFVSPIDETLASDEASTYFEPIENSEVIKNMTKSQKVQYFRKYTNYTRLLNVLKSVKLGNFDALLLLTTLHIPSVLPMVVPYIGGSRAIVIYSQFKELLVETYHHISSGNCPILAPSIHEIKARNYQAVPGKIHPVMTMRGGGGYVLWGTRVLPLEKVNAAGKGNNKKKKQKTEESS